MQGVEDAKAAKPVGRDSEDADEEGHVGTGVPMYAQHAQIRAIAAAFFGLVYFQLVWTGSSIWSTRSVVKLSPGVDTIRIHTAPTTSFRPMELATGRCTVRFVEPCDPQLEAYEGSRCDEETVLGYGINTGLFGSGAPRAETVGNELLVTVSAYQFWPFIFESWFNQIVCDIIVVSRGKRVFIQSERINVFLENVTIPSFTLSGPRGTTGGELWLQMKNVTVTEALDVRAAQGGILIERLSMPTSAGARLELIHGSIDVTTAASPRLTAVTQNQAVCIVGSTTAPGVQAFSLGNLTVHTADFACPPGEPSPCQAPSFHLRATGEHSSVGLHSLSHDSSSSWGNVYSGAGFIPFESSGTQPGGAGRFRAGADHTSLNNKILGYDYAYISVQGLGLMRGGLQLVYSRLPIWWFIEGEIQYLAVFSAFTVLPRMAPDYTATVSFCPAHGPLATKELIEPIRSVMGGVDAPGEWMFRNRGAVRDGMKPLVKRDGLNFYPPETGDGVDRYIPDCSYCADFTLWDSAYFVGSFAGVTGECEGFPDKQACKTRDCLKSSAHNFVLIDVGAGTCYPDSAVSSLMSNEGVVFDSMSNAMCWTSADVTCHIEGPGKGIPTTSIYFSWEAFFVLALSFIIAILLSCVALYWLYRVLVSKPRRKLITRYLVEDQNVLTLIQQTLMISQRFAVVLPPKHSNSASRDSADQSLLPEEHLVDFIGLGKIHQKSSERFSVFRPFRAIFKRLPLSVKKCFWSLGVGQKRKTVPVPVTVYDFASQRFVIKVAWASKLEVDELGVIQEEHLKTWAERSRGVELVEGARLVYVCGDRANEQIYSWDETIERADDIVQHNSKTPKELWFVLQCKIRQVKYVMQRLQIDVWNWYLLERLSPTFPVDLPEPKEPPTPYFYVGRKLYRESIHTLLGEIQALIFQLLFVLAPIIIAGFFCLALYQIRIIDLGVTDLGKNGRGHFWQEDLFQPYVIACLVLNGISLFIYQMRRQDWGNPQKPYYMLPEWFSRYRDKMAMFNKRKNKVFPDGSTGKRDYHATQEHTWAYFAERDRKYRTYQMEHNISRIVWTCEWFIALFYIFLVCVWILLGMFLQPNTLAPYATAIIGMITHVYSVYTRFLSFYEHASIKLKQEITNFNQNVVKRAIQQLNAMELARSMQERWPDIEVFATTRVQSLSSLRKWEHVDSLRRPQGHAPTEDGCGSANAAAEPTGAGAAGNGAGGVTDLVKEELQQGAAATDDGGITLPANAEKEKRQVEKLIQRCTTEVEEALPHELTGWLARHGWSSESIVVAVSFSAFMLLLVFIFLFIGMSTFTDSSVDTVQAAINSAITGAAAFILNAVSSGDTGKEKLDELIARIMDQYSRETSTATFSFSLDEDVSKMMERAVKQTVDEKDAATAAELGSEFREK